MAQLILIRHGQSLWNALNKFMFPLANVVVQKRRSPLVGLAIIG
ncbi:hypothetical protein VB775_14720 [Pseudanabaena sp. CCNP1317]|nr:hypothetical protein [Pseudanabaena sp. CCNP1317]MEA5488078.1 hypothetical protein [Pseudanabaena sp. CCNP1317]